nr:sensor histidine kinase [Pseudonocardia acidicola]
MFYRDTAELLAGTVPFVLSGLAAGEPVAVAVPGGNLDLLRAELGGDASRVQLFDMTEVGRNPGRIIAEVLLAVVHRHPGQRVRIIGEPIWPGRSELEYPACLLHEALINLAFRDRAATVLCPYDAAGLDARILADAAATHPVLIENGGRRPSADFAPEGVLARCNRPLPEPAGAAELGVDAGNLRQARHLVAERGRRAGLSDDQVDALVLAAGELLANSLRHGGGTGVLRIWPEPGHLVCEVRDAGRITDPLAGRRPADAHQQGGRGLLMVHHLADLVRGHIGPDGTTTRVYLRR